MDALFGRFCITGQASNCSSTQFVPCILCSARRGKHSFRAFSVLNFSRIMEQAIKEDILMQISNASQMVKLEKDPHAAFALIIDGKTLAYALEEDMKNQLLGLAVDCASVICCRVSPKQKALVCPL